MKTHNWINFKELKDKLNFNTVLEAYGIELPRNSNGGQRMGFCPLPAHNGERKSPSFSVNPERGIFHCFGCQASGNVIEFAALMDGLDPEDGKQFRQTALSLRDRFLGETVASDEGSPYQHSRPTPKVKAPNEPEQEPDADEELNVQVNALLDFALKSLKKDHPYLQARGLKEATIAHFGVGYASRGSMKGRIAIPIHNGDAELIGYTGRLADDDAIDQEHPKYRFPSKRERDGVLHEFRKSELLYNQHRVMAEGVVEELIVVEGAFDVMWLWQLGYRHTVALLGSSCSDIQAQRLIDSVSKAGLIWIFTDGDDPGRRCASELLAKLATQRLVSWVQADPGKDPCEHSTEDLERLFPQPSTSLRDAC
jgi:DNA primase